MNLLTSTCGMIVLFLIDFAIMIVCLVNLERHWSIVILLILSVLALLFLADAITKKLNLDR